MTGKTPEDATILYVHPITLDALLAQQRVSLYTEDGVVRSQFTPEDFRYPSIEVRPSREVVPNSVHRRRRVPDGHGHILGNEEGYIFEYVGVV